MRKVIALLAAAAAAVVVVTGRSGGGSDLQAQPTLTQRSVAGAVLGRNLGYYKTGFFRPPLLREAYPVSRAYEDWHLYALIWDEAKVAVYAPRTENRGIGILTWNPQHRTAAGVGPCTPLTRLLQVYGDRLRRVRVEHEAVYQLGRLWFTISHERVGVVQLSSPELGPQAALDFSRTELPRRVC